MSSHPKHICTEVPGATDPTSSGALVAAAAIILAISLIASSFPSLSKRAPRIEPPVVVFFIGKHFGTGVILSTAFVHLLQEGFESLMNPCLTGRWKNWSGLIVLSSFMAIFLVEYVSTVYVERLSKKQPPSKSGPTHEHAHHHAPLVPYRDDPEVEPSSNVEAQTNGHALVCHIISEEDTLDGADSRHHSRSTGPHRSSYLGHHRHESPTSHHHKAGPRLANRQKIIPIFIPVQADAVVTAPHSPSHGHSHEGHGHDSDTAQGEVSRRTRIIGILVLQLGIMLHSLVIGLTLSITGGSEFTTLLVAIIFHQLFEGLSLGIRISSLPAGTRATRLLPVILCILFAITTPLGILLGIWLLPSTPQAGLNSVNIISEPTVQTALLTKGLMCALSAGMLIYAAAVEMLAGDFVMDPEMRQHGLGKQVLGLGSLILGAIAMAIVG